MQLSVIIPTRNRRDRLAGLLDSLALQAPVSFDWEAIVVDNGSSDGTSSLCAEKIGSATFPLRYVLEPRPGLHYGRHRGACEARGAVLGYLDDDMLVAPSWIQGVHLLVDDEAKAVVGRVLPEWEAAAPEWVDLLFQEIDGGRFSGYLSLLDLGESERRVAPSLLIGCSLFIGKDLLFSLGGFNPDGMPEDLLRFRGDGETGLMKKFSKAGLECYYDPRATVHHIIDSHRVTLDYVCSRAFRQGISDSYTSIRADGGLTEKGASPRKRLRNKSPADIIRAALGKVRQALRKEDHPEVRRRLRQAYLQGVEFHRAEVRRDPGLLNYILKETYLDGYTDFASTARASLE